MRTIEEQLQESLEIFMQGFPEKHKEYYKIIKKYIEDKKRWRNNYGTRRKRTIT